MGKPAEVLDVEVLREALRRFTRALEAHREELDSLNVFPVPDGDTGTNLLLTQRAVMEAVDALVDPTPGMFAEAVARSSLMGARGNSGVILAQVLRGLMERWSSAGVGERGGAVLAEALARASVEARRAVARPVEGTVLTVLADAAAAAGDAARGGPGPGDDPAAVAVAARDAAAASLERTPGILPELAAAGVVDAGGLGVLLLLDAAASVIEGTDMTVAVGAGGPVGSAEFPDQDLSFKFEVVYLVRADESAASDLRERLTGIGDSVVVVGSSGRYKVHVHTDEPDAAVRAAGRAGAAEDVTVVDLEEQVAAECVAGQARAVQVGERQATAMVAIVDGDGLGALFRSLGAVVVAGGAGVRPSPEDLDAALEAAPAEAVVVVPTDAAGGAAAERAVGASEKDVWVVFAGGVHEGLAAAAAFNPTMDAAAATERMSEAAASVTSAAMRRVDAGGWVGVSGGETVANGIDAGAVAASLVSNLRRDPHEILTVVVGVGASEDETSRVERALVDALPGLLVEVHRGGQLGAEFVFGLE